MHRREFLVASASLGIAGCVASAPSSSSDGEASATGEGKRPGGGDGEQSTIEAPTLAEQGTPTTICEEPLDPDGIRAIGEPASGPPEEWPADPEGYRPLTDEQTVIGIEVNGTARAYPLTILNVHEIVNDSLGGPMIVTYCPICRSGMVADRRVDGEVATFDVSGLLWRAPGIQAGASEAEGRVFSDREEGVGNNGNLVMYDDVSGSYWSQILAQAICGPMKERRLSTRPATTASWGKWRETYPETEVLLPPPASTTVDPPI